MVKECFTTLFINDMDIYRPMFMLNKQKRRNLKEISKQGKKARTGDSDFSHLRYDDMVTLNFDKDFLVKDPPILRTLNLIELGCLTKP